MTSRIIMLLVLGGSIIAQAAAAISALRLVGWTGRRVAWGLISGALILMILRRILPLYHLLVDSPGAVYDIFGESIGLVLSVILAAGVLRVGAIFTDLQRLETDARVHAERFRTLFGRFPLPILEFDFAETQALFEEMRARGVVTLDPHLLLHPECAGFSLEVASGLKANDAAAAFFGTADADTLLRRLKGVVLDGARASFSRALAAFWEGALEFRDDTTVSSLDGSSKNVTIQYLLLTDSGPHGARVIVTLVDFTARKRAESALQESEQKYRQIWEYSSDLIFLVEVADDGRLRRSDHNPIAQRIFHVEPANGRPRYLDEEVPEAEREKLIGPVAECARTGVPSARELCLGTPHGERLFDETLIPVSNDRGKVNRIISIMRDITERKLAENEIRKLNARLEERVLARTRELAASNCRLAAAYDELKEAQSRLTQQEKMASLGQLTAGIAHEINNPLAYVSSNIERFDEYFHTLQGLLGSWRNLIQTLPDRDRHNDLLRTVVDQEREADLEYISENFGMLMTHTKEGAERIKTIVAQLRGFARLADGGFTPSDLNAALEDCLLFVWNEIKYKAVVRRAFGDIPHVECNLGEIKQVMVNLLVNAAQAIHEQGEITLRTWSADGRAFVEIADTGVGISRENLKRVFDPFFTTKPVGKGTGLGLWISTTIVQKHNGTLTAVSAPGKGSTFTIGLPVHQQEVSLS